jgi:hypothetical protein
MTSPPMAIQAAAEVREPPVALAGDQPVREPFRRVVVAVLLPELPHLAVGGEFNSKQASARRRLTWDSRTRTAVPAVW